VIQSNRMIPRQPRRLLFLDQSNRAALHGLAVERAVLRKMLQHAPTRLQVHRRQNLGDGVFFPTQDHPRDPLGEPHPSGMREPQRETTNQRLPTFPQCLSIVHDAFPPGHPPPSPPPPPRPAPPPLAS